MRDINVNQHLRASERKCAEDGRTDAKPPHLGGGAVRRGQKKCLTSRQKCGIIKSQTGRGTGNPRKRADPRESVRPAPHDPDRAEPWCAVYKSNRRWVVLKPTGSQGGTNGHRPMPQAVSDGPPLRDEHGIPNGYFFLAIWARHLSRPTLGAAWESGRSLARLTLCKNL